MSPDIRDLLRHAAPAPRHPIDVDALATTAQVRRSRRRRGLAGGSALLVVILISGATVAALNDDEEPARVEVAVLRATSPTSDVSIDLPPGWQHLPRSETTDPAQVLVVGTSARPEAEPIVVCDPDRPAPPGAAYISIYEYSTGAPLNSPDHLRVYDGVSFVPRPDDFGGRWVETCPSPSTPPEEAPFTSEATMPIDTAPTDPAPVDVPPITEVPGAEGNRFGEYPFVDGGRFFLASVVSTDDASGSRFAEALGVLNTFTVPPPVGVTTLPPTDGPTTTAPAAAAPPDAEAVARQAISDALRGAFGGGGPYTADEAIVGGMPIRGQAAVEARDANEGYIGVIVPRVNGVVLHARNLASVNFDLLIDGHVITANTNGEVVFVDGMWKITPETFCTVARRGSVPCPSP